MKVKVTELVSRVVEREIPDEWKKCCRCFPNAVSEAGFCGCCCFDHATGKREKFEDPDFFAPMSEPISDGEVTA